MPITSENAHWLNSQHNSAQIHAHLRIFPEDIACMKNPSIQNLVLALHHDPSLIQHSYIPSIDYWETLLRTNWKIALYIPNTHWTPDFIQLAKSALHQQHHHLFPALAKRTRKQTIRFNPDNAHLCHHGSNK